MDRTTLKEAFERGTEAFNAHDSAAFADTMTEDVSARAPGVGTLRGKAAVNDLYQGFITAFPDARVEVEATFVQDDALVEEGVFSGTHRGVLRTGKGDIPPTGRSVRLEYLQAIRYRDDRASSFHLVYDRAEMMEQLGLAPEAPEQEVSASRPGSEPQPPAVH
jgi:predicted ester cyclase